MKAFSFSSILKNFGKQLSSLASQMPWCNLRFNLGSMSVLSRVNPLFSRTSFALSRRVSHFAAILTILFTIGVGNMWGEIIDLTPDDNAITINNKKWKKVGEGYVSRNGSSTTVYTDGLTTGGGNTYVVFDVAVPSTIEAKFINVSTSGYENKPVLCGKVSDTQWSAIESAVSGDTEYQLSIEDANKLTAGSITLPKNNQNGTTSCSFTATAAGKYAIYWTSSINDKVRLYEIEITASSSSGTPVTSVSLNKTSTTLEIGGTETLTATIEPDNATNKKVTWSSDATSVATVDEDGLVTAVAAGTATITVTTADGNKTATCAVTVNAASGGGDVYYLIPYSANVADGKLKAGGDGSTGVYKCSGTTISKVTDISATNTSSAASVYYNSTSLDYSSLTNLANYSASSSSNKTMKGIKLTSGNSIEIDPEGKTFSQLDVIYRCASTDAKSITIAGKVCNTNDQNFHLKTITETFSNSITISNSSGKEYNLFIILKESSSCTAPNHVDISGRWDRFGGETISLTAAAYASAGTGSPIADGDITGWQWQKYVGSAWENVSNGGTISGATTNNLQITSCTGDNSGTYRCVVTTGTGCETPSDGFNVKVYRLEIYSGTTGTYDFTRVGDTQAGTLSVNLAAGAHTFKIHADNNYYGNNAAINEDVTNWVFATSQGNCTLNAGLGGTFTIRMEYGTGGNSSNAEEPEISVTYPRKTIYLTPGVWNADGAKFAIYYFRKEGETTYGNGWTDFLTADDCGRYADIPQWNGVQMIAVRFNSSKASTGNWEDKWNQTSDLTVTNNDLITITGWDNSQTYNSNFSTPTYTISYNAGTGGSGSKASESKTCGVDFTLPSSAVFTATGYTQTGWTTSDGGAQTHALGGSYTGNAAQTFYPVWTANQYTVTHTLDGVTKSSGATGANAATYGTNYTAEFAASSGYALPETITVTIGGSTKTQGTEYTWDQGTGTVTITGSYITGNIVITITGESDDPCSEPAEVTNEIARFFVPCGTSTSEAYTVINQLSSTGDNTFTTSGFGGSSSNWYRNETSGLIYGKLSGDNSYILLKLESGRFQAGDVVTAYFNANNGTKTGLKLKSTDGNGNEPSTTAKEVETSSTYTLVAADIESVGSIKLFRAGSATYVNRIIVTRPACTNVSITTEPTTPVAATVGSACSITGLVAAGTSPTYQWYTCNSDGSSATAIDAAGTLSFTGYTTATLGLTPTATGATYYKCVVSGSCGDPVTSSVVTVNASAAPASALITYNLKINTSGTTLKNSVSTTDETNITNIDIDQTNSGANGDGTTNRTTKLAIKTGANGADWSDTPTNYVLFKFKVACGKKLTPSKIRMKVANVGGASADNIKYKAVMSDNFGHSLTGTYVVATQDGTVETFDIDNADASKYFQGEVTLKLWAWTIASKDNGGSAFRMGADVKLFGEVQNAADYTVTHTLSNVTKSSGATSVKEGNTYTATYAASSGYTLPSTITVTIGGASKTVDTDYTWNSETGVVTIPGNKATGNIVITVTGVVAATYALNYECNGAESGCPSNVAATTNLPNPLPTGLTKDGYDFGGWFTDSECTVAAVAGAALTGNTDLYAKWTERGSECEDTPHAWDVIATSAKSYKVRISKVTEEVAIPIDDATASNLTAYAGTSSTSDNVTVKIADGGSSKYGYKFDGSNTYLKLVFSTPLVLNDTLVVGMTNAAHNISFTTTAVRATTLSTSGGKLIIPAALAGQSTIYLWRGSGTTMYLRSFAVKHECEAIPSCTTPVLEDLSAQTKCLGEDVTWTANNTATLADGEAIAYQWNKKGNNTVLSSNATLTLTGITEAAGGTYVVTAIVSADGKASKTASKEVTLTVIPATATPTITANASTIYTGNSVTLTATCASNGVGYQWYTCTDAEGNGESAIGGATNATCTLTAGEAGTYYYKVIVTGDGTHSCGTAEKVYTLVVSASNSGETTCGEITGQFTNGAYTFDTDFIIYGVNSGGNLEAGASSSSGNNRCGGSGRYLGKQRFVVTFPVDVLSFSFIGYQSNQREVVAVKTTTELKTTDTEYTTINHTSEVSQEGNCQTHVITPETAIPANTFVWVELNNGLNISEICYVPVSNVNCTDPQVTATIDDNATATVCAGTENVTFTAANYADGASFQWQKKNGNTWKNIDATSATSATYTIISPVTTEHAGQYRVIATKECSRTSEEVTLTVLTAPEFNAFANTASVMKGNALTINDVEATNATDYTWYKSADATYDAGTDTKVGTTKELLLAASSITEEADQIFYLFCVASNSCGSAESNAITVTVTPFVEEECATKGNEGEHEFGFVNTDCSSDTYGDSKTPVWKTSSRSKYLTYTAPEGKYFATAKVTVAHTGGTKCGYAYSTNGGTTWVVAELGGLSATLTAITIELPANVNAFRISRNLTAQDGEKGSASGNFYLSEACFTYENACTPTSVTPTTTSYEYNISTPADFEEPPFTVKHGEDIVNDAVLTYTSSNPAIATVDEEGNVTFEGRTGTVTITATYEGATIDEIEYCASEGSYTITVLCEDEEPKIIVAAGTNLDGCNNSITLEAKMQDGTTAFTGGTYQWYRDGEAIEGATSASYEVVRAGTYTVSRTYTCTTMSSNSAVVTNENPEPKVERLTPFQYYHVNKDYSNQMKDRHLFAVTSYGTLDDGKRYHLTATRNGVALNLSSSTAFFTIPSSDNAVDTVMIDLNELKDKYLEGDEIVITCAPINNCNQVSAITSSITIHVIGQTPTLALICSGANGDGTRDTEKLVVGGDFLTGYNKADLCQQTGNKTFDPDIEWGFYTELKEKYIVTPVNGYAQFNKLNYEPFDILLLTDYPKSSKSEAAQKIIDDMAELCDYRPLLSFKTHFQSDKWKDKTTGEYKYTKWVKKGFTTAPVVPKQTATYVNIVCYAHPMFEDIDDINDQYTFHDDDDPNQLVYQVLTGPGHEGKKGIQGFELADADNFVTIGLVHYNAIAEEVTHDDHTHISWNAEANDRLLVAMAERQTNIEARMMLFSLNCGAQSLQTPGGRNVILQCLKYLLETDPLKVADCRMTFDNGAGNADFDPNNYEGTGTRGDSLWSTAANWGPDYLVVPGRNNDVRIAAPCIVDGVKTKVSVGDEVQETIQYYPEVLSIHITENGSLTIPANSSLTARSTILRADENGNVYPTNVADISLGSNADGNASLILNNERGDTKAGVAMYSKAEADMENMSADNSTWQYIGTPHTDVQNATYNYYDSWLYQYNTDEQGWVVVPTGGAVEPWVGYCITHPERGHTYWMEGTLAATTNQDITIPKGKFVVVANSWTAPIQINELTDDDMEGLTDKSIYFFNTGSDPEGDNSLTANATGEARWAPSTYISVPIHAADYTDKDANIPSMQGFYVVGDKEADGTLHLDYERHVRAPRTNTPSGPMHAPARITDTDNEPQVAKFLFRGKRYDDRLIILERPDFTRGYDSGWDGEQWGGNAAAPMSYVVAETRYDAVSAIPEYEGTVIGFRAGEDNIYTIHFDYDGMEEALYLLDTETKIYTRVLKGNSYTFACPDKAEHNRFILTRKAPQIATGTENIATGENAKAVKFIKDDKIFIFVNGILYDATGKMVIR